MDATELAANVLSNGAKQPFDLGRMGISHRIGQADLIATGFNAGNGKPPNGIFIDSAFERAAESGGQAGFDMRAAVLGQRIPKRAGPLNFLDHLIGGAPHIGQGMTFANRDGEGDFGRSGGNGVFHASEIGRQGGDRKAVDFPGAADDGVRVIHAFNHIGRHERTDFDFPDARRRFRLDPLELVGRRHKAFRVLQAVTRPDFGNKDVDFFNVLHRRHLPFYLTE